MTKLEQAIGGREVLAYVDGQNTPTNRRSNLYYTITSMGFTPDDIGKAIDVVLGAKRHTASDGYKMAIVKL